MGRALRVLGSLLLGRRTERDQATATEPGLHDTWVLAARECGIENLVSKRAVVLGPRRIEGARPPLTVSILPLASNDAVIEVRGVTPGIRLNHESIRSRASKLAGTNEIAIGDPDFDAQFFVGGDAFLLRALLDAPSRVLAVSLFGRRPGVARELLMGDSRAAGVEDGRLVARFDHGGFPYPPFSPADILGKALALGERLLEDRVEERLLATVRTDPLPDVRLAAVAALRDERPRHAATREALESACDDKDPRVRLVAALALGGPRCQATLLQLASDTMAPDAVSARAVSELRSHLPADRARSILSDALRNRQLLTAAACLGTLGRSGPHADVIARVLALEEGDLALAAAKALGRCGSLDEIPLLREVESRYPRGHEVPQACRAAIAAIHTRQPGASPGQLSLAGERAGELSLARDEKGRISIAREGDRRER